MRKFTEEERNEFCAKALLHVKKQYPEVWKPQSGQDEYLGIIDKYSGAIAEYALYCLSQMYEDAEAGEL